MVFNKSCSSVFFCVLFLIFQLHLHPSIAQSNVRSAYWFPDSGFPLSDIDSTLFTHLFCAFAGLDKTTYQLTVSDTDRPQFSSFTKTVQGRNPSIRTLLSIGGGNANRDDFAAMARQASTRKSFIDSSISLARSFGFHGLDIDWEYPQQQADMANFGSLLTEWRVAVAAESGTSGMSPLLLTAAVNFSPRTDTGAMYPTQVVANNLDWINVMVYDFYAPDWSKTVAGPPAALFNPQTKDRSGDSGISAWVQAGFPTRKIVFGVPFIGYAWQLVDPNKHDLFAPANGAGLPVDNGAQTFKEIKGFVRDKNAMTVFNASVVADYCYAGTTWIGYDDVQSISRKIRYIKNRGLLGYFAWHVGGDDNFVLSKQAVNAWSA